MKSTFLRLPRTMTRLSIAALLAILALVVNTAPAQAYLYAGGGAIGPYVASAPVDCRHKIFGGSSLLHMHVPPPAVYAKNVRTGWGNDGSWVRFRTFLVNHKTGQTVASNGWSQWVYAYDNAPARWWGEQFFSADARYGNMYRVDYRIEWWNSTAMTGWVADRSTSYQYYSQTLIRMSNMNTCWMAG